jgi:pleiotropic regulator 1
VQVISGHLGWIRSVAIDPANEWFATGAADRSIKARRARWATCPELRRRAQIWDLASGTLKLTLTGHINTVMALAISERHPYLFSAGADKTVKCEPFHAVSGG